MAVRNLDDFKKLWQTRRIAALIIGIYFVFLPISVLFSIYVRFFQVPELKGKIADQQSKIQGLEAELAPFRTAALMKFPGDSDALKKLAADLGQVEKQIGKHETKIGKIEERLTEIEQKSGKQLSTEFPSGYYLIGISGTNIYTRVFGKTRDVMIEWENAQVTQLADHIEIKLPNIRIPPGINFENNTVGIPKRPGTYRLLSLPGFQLIAQVLAVEDNQVILAASAKPTGKGRP